MSEDGATTVPGGEPPAVANDVELLGDIGPAAMRAHLHRMADWVADYREGLEGRSITPAVAPGVVTMRAGVELPELGTPMSVVLDDLESVVMPGILHWGHPSFLAYFGSTSNGAALLGEIAAATLNVSAMTWATSPAATELESVVLRWLRGLVGLDPGVTGIVYDTASVAVLHALAAARERCVAQCRSRGMAGRLDVPVLRVYASDQAHSSVAKAMIMLGLGEENLVRIPTDPAFRMEVDLLREAMSRDVQRGFRPMAVVATVGTTSTASVDPVSLIADVCDEHDAWLHVDAAYGGAMAAIPEGRWVMGGTERAHSVVVNPHKWLFVPLDFSVLFVRDAELLREVFALTPEYLEGDATPPAVGDRAAIVNYMDYGIQLGRRFRALKAWMTFRAFGRAGIESRLREHCRLASLLASWIRAHDDFELSAPQLMGVVCFRYAPIGVAADEVDRRNSAIVELINSSGEAHLTHTRLRGRTCMRVGFGNVATQERHVRALWDMLVRYRSREETPAFQR